MTQSTRRRVRLAIATVLGIGALAIPGSGSDAGQAKYSGTVVAVNRTAGSIVVEGMGPWRIKDGVIQLERRTIGVAPSTEFVRVKRATGAAPSGWEQDFVESALPEWQVKPGDWVTVTARPDGARMTAARIEVGDPSEL
jgi:hypothetical protein